MSVCLFSASVSVTRRPTHTHTRIYSMSSSRSRACTSASLRRRTSSSSSDAATCLLPTLSAVLDVRPFCANRCLASTTSRSPSDGVDRAAAYSSSSSSGVMESGVLEMALRRGRTRPGEPEDDLIWRIRVGSGTLRRSSGDGAVTTTCGRVRSGELLRFPVCVARFN